MENIKRINNGIEEQFNPNLNNWVAPMVVTVPYNKYGAQEPCFEGVSGVFGALFQKIGVGVNEFLIQGRNPNNDGYDWLHFDGTYHWTKHSGTSSERPTTQDGIKVGFCYFDTDLKKPIWWSGDTSEGKSGWVDATGTPV